MKKLSTIFRATKVLMINLMIASLLQNPFITNAMAEDVKKTNSFDSQDVSNVAKSVLGVYGNYLGQKQQIIQQQMMATQNQQLMSQMSPNCRKPDGSACFVTPAKYFPECSLPASMSNMPNNVCPSNPTTNPMQISNMLTYESIAKGWVNYYEQMKNKASNATYPTGLRCLEDKQKAMDSQLLEMVNSLQRLQDRLKQDSQIFRDNNKKLLTDMDKANAELFGSDKGDLNSKTSDFSKFFSQSCQTVIGKDILSNAKAKGLNGILQERLSPINKSASDFNLNKASIEADIRSETDKIAATIKSGGVDDFLKNGYIPQSDENASHFGALAPQIAKQNKEFMTAKARIDKTLADVGYTAPALTSTFSTDSTEFMANSADFFKKKYVNDCVTGNSAGIAIPVNDILNSIQQRSTNSEGTARNDYKIALKRVLDSDAMIEDKMSQVKALEAQYPDMTVTYSDAGQSRVIESPYSLFMKTINACQQRYAQDDQSTAAGASGGSAKISAQKKTERAQAALQELKNLNDGYASKVTSAILSQVLDCGGTSAKSGSCSEQTLDSSAPNFCISHAGQCANEIQGCYAEANNQIQVRKTKMQNLAKTFNSNVFAMVARTNSLYEQQKAAVTNMTKLIQQRFPGTNFEIPGDMFIPSPELKKDTYGVEMAADGKLADILDGEGSMPKKLEKLKDMFKKQREEVDKTLTEYKNDQQTAMTDQIDRWKDLVKECTTAADGSMDAIAKQNQAGQKAQADQDKKVAKFCKKYYSIASNPVASCGKASDLASIADEVQARLSDKALQFSEQYAAVCDGYSNESSGGTDSVSNPKDCERVYKDDTAGMTKCLNNIDKKNKSTNSDSTKKLNPDKLLNKLCNKGDGSEADFITAAISKLSTSDQTELKDIKTLDEIIKRGNDNKISEDAADFFNGIKKVASTDTSDKKLCAKLKNATSGSNSDKYSDTKYEDTEKALTKEKDEADKKVVEAQAAVEKAKESIKTVAIKKTKGKKAKTTPDPFADLDKSADENNNKNVKDAKAKLVSAKEDAQKALDKLHDLPNKKISTENKAVLDDALETLAGINAPTDPDSKSVLRDKVSHIGEQATGPCDMQSNTNIAKGMGLFDLPAGYDESRLGTSR